MSELGITEAAKDRATGPKGEDIWSRVVREAELLRTSSAEGISQSVRTLQNKAGEPIVAALAGAAIAGPLMLLSNRYRFIAPALDLLGVGCAVSLASDGAAKLGTIGSVMADYWNHPEHKEVASKAIAANIGPLFIDSVGAYTGFAGGSRYATKFAQRLESTKAHYRELDVLRRQHKQSQEHPKPDWIEGHHPLMDEDAYWAARAVKAEKSGWAGVEESMKELKKWMKGKNK